MCGSDPKWAVQSRRPELGVYALHLAIARNNLIEEALTLDDGLLIAAKRLKIKARRGIL